MLRISGPDRLPFTLQGTYRTTFKAGEVYEVGMVGISSQFSKSNNNGIGQTSVEVSY